MRITGTGFEAERRRREREERRKKQPDSRRSRDHNLSGSSVNLSDFAWLGFIVGSRQKHWVSSWAGGKRLLQCRL